MFFNFYWIKNLFLLWGCQMITFVTLKKVVHYINDSQFANHRSFRHWKDKTYTWRFWHNDPLFIKRYHPFITNRMNYRDIELLEVTMIKKKQIFCCCRKKWVLRLKQNRRKVDMLLNAKNIKLSWSLKILTFFCVQLYPTLRSSSSYIFGFW